MDELDSLFESASVVGGEETERDWLTISHDFRSISIPSNKKLAGVTSDEKVNTLWFKCDRYYDDVDLSEFDFRINYMNAQREGDQYLVTDLEAQDDDSLTFSWTVGRHACQYAGSIQFIVCAILPTTEGSSTVVEKEYNTAIHSLSVVEGLETSEEVYTANYDIIEEFFQEIQRAHDIDQYVSDAEAYGTGKRGGATITDTTDPAYHNNAPYYNDEASADALKSEGYAVGKQNGTDVGSGSDYYQNNAKYYHTQVSAGATTVRNLMLSGMLVVTDTTSTSKTIAAEAETRYILGTLTALTISSLPSSGLVDIIFTSGSTATTLTLPSGTSMPAWFDASDLEANTKYELNFEDGCGVVSMWPVASS